MKKTLVLDNGSYGIKCNDGTTMHHIPNFQCKTKDHRSITASSYNQVPHSASPISAFEKGYLVNWNKQIELWDHLFGMIKCNPKHTSLVLTEPIFNLRNISHSYDQIVFEYYEFAEYHKTSAPFLASRKIQSTPNINNINEFDSMLLLKDCFLIVDIGHAFTTIVPFINGVPIVSQIKRIEVGGALLTHSLQEVISFRQWNMMDEHFIINHVKENCCFVSDNFKNDMISSRIKSITNPLIQRYILPDFSNNTRGYIKDANDFSSDSSDQIILMGNERFTIPELLFHPSDKNILQAGLPEVISRVINSVSKIYSNDNGDILNTIASSLYANINLIGGSSLFKGIGQRLQSELRSFADSSYPIRVIQPSSPIEFSVSSEYWFSEMCHKEFVSKQDYLEYGENILLKFRKQDLDIDALNR